MTIEILDYQDTPLGTLILRRRELVSQPGVLVTEVTLNHEFLMSSYLTKSEKALTRIGLEIAQATRNEARAAVDGLQVLVGGLGLGYTAAEALKSSSVSSVSVIEYLPEVIGWTRDGLIPLADELKSERRLKIVEDDIYRKLTSIPDQQFDLIVIDVDHSPVDVLGDQSHGFYTLAGLRATREHLAPGGVLGVWSYAADTPLLEKMQTVFPIVRSEKVTVWNDLIDVEQTDWLFFGVRS